MNLINFDKWQTVGTVMTDFSQGCNLVLGVITRCISISLSIVKYLTLRRELKFNFLPFLYWNIGYFLSRLY